MNAPSMNSDDEIDAEVRGTVNALSRLATKVSAQGNVERHRWKVLDT